MLLGKLKSKEQVFQRNTWIHEDYSLIPSLERSGNFLAKHNINLLGLKRRQAKQKIVYD